MGLSRLDNFLKSTRGTVIYVDPNSLDATDSIENQGNSLTRPFKTIQRALIEASRFSYQQGFNNDRFGKTTIILYPGDHIVDNRPGWIPDNNLFRLRDGTVSADLSAWDSLSNFDLTTSNNILYKLNSIHGGVIIPRGTSIVGMDLRKTKIRPTYVPNPENDQIERSCVFRVTGGSYFWQFSIFDADPNSLCYKDYTNNTFLPNFSHHKLSVFEYADGVNDVKISDDFMTYISDRTDLEMYYAKVGIVYGQATGRPIEPDYPSPLIDIQPSIDEYQIVGSRGATVGITSIISGDGTTPSTTVTVTLDQSVDGLDIDTPIQILGVNGTGYDGQYVVNQVVSPKVLKYQVANTPANPSPPTLGATFSVSVDTVNSASPYIFNISLRSVYGMCGILADGNSATGFKSMVVAQFTGIGLQKDDNAFVKYDYTTGQYKDSTSVVNLHSDSQAKFKPTYENFHIKAVNNAYLQLVSVFAIGYANHFVTESGGDFSINNSNSNFGSRALVASGFRDTAFAQDDTGYVTHIIPPREIETTEINLEFPAIDVALTAGIGITSRLYLYDETNPDTPPADVVDGFRFGAKANEKLYVQISQGGQTQTYSSRVIMPDTAYTFVETSSEKYAFVNKQSVTNVVGFGNSISNNIITFTYPHQFINGESIRILSDDGHLPDGISNNELYYAITTGLNIDQIKIAQTLSDAINGQSIDINAQGGTLYVVSRVSDKVAGDIGHPIQFDSTNNNWYINVSTTVENQIFSAVKTLGTANLGKATPRTYIKRTPDTRGLIDTIYRLRYVLPKDSAVTARPPLDGYVLQFSNNVLGTGTTEITKYFNPNTATLSNSTELRNPSFIANAFWYGGYAFVDTEVPHNLKAGSQVKLSNIKSTNNITGIAGTGFNNTYTVVGVSSAKQFTVILPTNPGTFANNTSSRDSNLPYFQRKRTYGTYQVYRSQEIKRYIPNIQDGVYHIIIVNCSNSPTVAPFGNLKFSQPIQNLYPQTNRDNPKSDPNPTQCFALSDQIGKVVVNDPQNSLSKESLARGLYDVNVGFGLTNIITNSNYIDHTFYTAIDHGLSGITSVGIVTGGSGYVQGNYYNAKLVGIGTSVTGAHATALVVVGAAGTITSVKIMDGGSAYGIGNTLAVVGVGTAGSPGTGAVVRVNNIVNSVNDSLSILGISSLAFLNYNTTYRVTGVSVGKPREISVRSSEIITGITTLVLGNGVVAAAGVNNSGKAVQLTSFTYDNNSGITTFNFPTAHGFKTNNKLRLAGADDTFFNSRDYVVKKVNSLTSLIVNAGVTTVAVSTGGTSLYAMRHGFTSYGGDVNNENENVSGRIIPAYAGITTTIGATILSTTSDNSPFIINNAVTAGLKIGDFLIVDDEIVRIKTNVTNDSVYVFRALLGSVRQTHQVGSVIRKIFVPPFEFRRNSIIRASGHTFEYMGFGPGNYSTAFPEKQTRVLSAQEELLAQSAKVDGGVSIYTGMDNKGNFFTGNKKINSATGQEEVYDSPIPTITGEDPGQKNVNVGFDVLTPLEITVSRSLRIEGGPNRNLISEFDGPVIFNGKITSNAPKGIEANSLLLQGNATISRKYTVGIATPTSAGNAGDVVYFASPDSGGTLGWVYTRQNKWEKFGRIFNNGIDGVGVSSAGINTGTTNLINFVGIGLTVQTNYDSSGITTVTINGALPYGNVIGISTGNNAENYSGIATQINFVGSGITISASAPVNGISTVTFTRALPSVITASQFIKTGAAGTNFLKADGSDALITFAEVTNALGFTPANASAIPSSNYPQGNSLVLDDFNLPAQGGPFDGSKTDFNVNINGIAYTTPGTAANLIISIGGVIQKPGTDYLVVQSNNVNTNVVRFTTAPSANSQNFGIALGGQGALATDPIWDFKGDLVVGIANNTAVTLQVGSDNQILTADSSVTKGMKWSSSLNISSLIVGSGVTIGSAATFSSSGLNFNTGIITAASFSGNLSGSASTASFATTSYGLTGNPIISLSGVVCTTGTGIITATGYRIGTALTITSSGVNANTGVITAKTFVGNGTIPVGGIIMWSGTIANIPTGWALCNGQTQNGQATPDLRNRFIVGAGSDTNSYVSGIGSTVAPSGQIGAGTTGGSDTVTLVVDNLPPHNHNLYYAAGQNIAFGSNTGVPIEINDGTALPLQGSATPIENRPPYYALAFIMRTI